MKKYLRFITILIVIFIPAFVSTAESDDSLNCGNVSFTVWKLENGLEEVSTIINTSIPEVFRRSCLFKMITFDITGGKTCKKIFKKEGYQFSLSINDQKALVISVSENNRELFSFIQKKASTVRYIFYDTDSRAYTMEAVYSIGESPIGLISPGIMKRF